MRNSNSRSRIVSTRAVIAVIFVLFTMGLPLVGASTASAEFISDGDDEYLIKIDMESIHGRGSVLFNPNVNEHMPDHARGRVVEAMNRREEVRGNGNELIGTIESLSIVFDGDPLVSIAFSATAGSADTTFTITSALVTFPELTDPIGEAFASLTLFDMAGSTAGAFVEPVGVSTAVYRAEYNGGNLFIGELGIPIVIDGTGTGGTSSNSSGNGPVTISGAVTSIQGKIAFELSAGDKVSGETWFEVTPVPEPSSWAMMAMAAIGLFACGWRWRRLW